MLTHKGTANAEGSAMNDTLARLMVEAQPVQDAELARNADSEISALVARVVIRCENDPQVSSVPRRRRTVVAAVVGAALLAGAAGTAAASWLALRTGQIDEMTQTEEWRLDSPETRDALVALTKDYPLAPGYTPDSMVAQLAGQNAQMPELGFRQSVFGWSLCTWEQTWLGSQGQRRRGC